MLIALIRLSKRVVEIYLDKPLAHTIKYHDARKRTSYWIKSTKRVKRNEIRRTVQRQIFIFYKVWCNE